MKTIESFNIQASVVNNIKSPRKVVNFKPNSPNTSINIYLSPSIISKSIKIDELEINVLRSSDEWDYNHGWVIISESGKMSSNRKENRYAVDLWKIINWDNIDTIWPRFYIFTKAMVFGLTDILKNTYQ